MPFTEDLSPFLNPDDFADVATWTPSNGSPTSVNGILDKEFEELGIGTPGVQGSRPVFICSAADVDGIAEGESFKVCGVDYTVAFPQPDGTGMTVVVLKEV